VLADIGIAKKCEGPGEVVTQGLAAPVRPTRDIRVEATTTMTRKPQAGSATGKSSSRRRQEDIREESSRGVLRRRCQAVTC
jgi:hypothetical protein